MTQPVQVIYQYYNNSNKIRYIQYIFIGYVSGRVNSILKKIQDMSFSETMLFLSYKDLSVMRNNYGKDWYRYFFVPQHIERSLKDTPNTNRHKITRLMKKGNMRGMGLKGLVYKEDEDFEEDLDKNIKVKEDDEIKIVDATVFNIRSTKQMKKEARMMERTLKTKKMDTELSFDSSELFNPKNQSRSEIFRKHYIKNQIITYDDTVISLMKKICISFEGAFEGAHLIPSRMYLWNNTVPLAHHWLRKGENFEDFPLKLHIDIKAYKFLEEEWVRHLYTMFKRHWLIFDARDTTLVSDHFDDNVAKIVYCRDIYNEISNNKDILSNMEEKQLEIFSSTYLKLYYPNVRDIDFQNIISYNNSEKELNHFDFNIILNELVLVKRAEFLIEYLQPVKSLFTKFFLTGAAIHAELPVDLSDMQIRTMLDYFTVDDKYPSIQYNPPYAEHILKVYTKTFLEEPDAFVQQYMHSPYGFVFKIKLENRYLVVNMRNNNVEARIQWTKDDEVNEEYIENSYIEVQKLIRKLNSAPLTKKLKKPEKDEFDFSYINGIQLFKLNTKVIDHNDLSDFYRLLFPYVALVIAPKKRGYSEKSKHGTYLRFRRVSKFQAQSKMEEWIVKLIREYKINDQRLIDQITRDFNITVEAAQKELAAVREKYGETLKTEYEKASYDKIPRFKQPGISVEIQGKEQPLIKISGCKNQDQLNRILEFMNKSLTLFELIYIKQSKEKIFFDDISYTNIKKVWLPQLQHIAKRRDMVDVIHETVESRSVVKMKTSIDRQRLHGWARICQGVRQPTPYKEIQLTDRGFKKNKQGLYTKNYKNQEIYAIPLPSMETGILSYWTCDSAENSTYIHIGYAKTTKKNPNACLPCCFKKNRKFSANKEIRNYFEYCLGTVSTDDKDDEFHNSPMLLYILQKSKLTNYRLGMLDRQLGLFLNHDKQLDIDKSNVLLTTGATGYNFAFGMKTSKYSQALLVNSVAVSMGMKLSLAHNKINKFVKNNRLYIKSLFNGLIGKKYQDVGWKEYPIPAVIQLLSSPGCINKEGINIFVLKRDLRVVKKVLEMDQRRDYYEPYMPPLDIQLDYTMCKNRRYLLLLQDITSIPNHFNPVFHATKTNEKARLIDLVTNYSYKDDVIQKLLDYYKKNGLVCENTRDLVLYPDIEAYTRMIVKHLDIKEQVMDSYYQSMYLKLKDDTILPVKRGNLLSEYPITNICKKTTLEKELSAINKYSNKINYLKNIRLSISPKKKIYQIILDHSLVIPVIESNIVPGYKIQKKSSDEYLADTSLSYLDDGKISVARKAVRKQKYIDENYNIFIYHLSNYLNKEIKIKNKIIDILNSAITSSKKRAYVYKIIKKLLASSKSFWKLTFKLPNTDNYYIENYREICGNFKSRNTCNPENQCTWTKNKCVLGVWRKMADTYLFRVSATMTDNYLTRSEILQLDGHSFSNIVDPEILQVRPNQLIFREDNPEYLENILRQKLHKTIELESIKSVAETPFPTLFRGDYLVQEIVEHKDTIFRCLANVYYWNRFTFLPEDKRNLGYESSIQFKIASILKKNILDNIDAKWKKKALLRHTVSDNHVLPIVKTFSNLIGKGVILCKVTTEKVIHVIRINVKKDTDALLIGVKPWKREGKRQVPDNLTSGYSIYKDPKL